MVFCPRYTKPTNDLPADGVILESADGAYFYSELGVLAEKSEFFKDIQALESVSTKTDSAEQSGTESASPQISLPRKGKMEPKVVIDNMRDIVIAADYLSINRDGLVEFTSEFDDPYKALAVVCALDPRDQAGPSEEDSSSHEDDFGDDDVDPTDDDDNPWDSDDEPCNEPSEEVKKTDPDEDDSVYSSDEDEDDDDRRLSEIKRMMEDKVIYGDFYDRLVRSQKTCEQHMENLEDYLQAGFGWVSQMEEELPCSFTPWGICRPTARNRRKGCAAYRKFHVFGDMVMEAKWHVMDDIRSHGSTHFAYKDDEYAYRRLSSIIPCRKCLYHLGESFQHNISTYPPDEENCMDDNPSTGGWHEARFETWLEQQCYSEVPDDFHWGEEVSIEDDRPSGSDDGEFSDGEFTDDDWA